MTELPKEESLLLTVELTAKEAQTLAISLAADIKRRTVHMRAASTRARPSRPNSRACRRCTISWMPRGRSVNPALTKTASVCFLTRAYSRSRFR